MPFVLIFLKIIIYLLLLSDAKNLLFIIRYIFQKAGFYYMTIHFNKKQKITFAICIIFILLVFIIWIINGTYVFTQTQVLVEKKDPLFGTTYKEWQNKFILGLDFTLAISAVSIISSAVLFFLFKDKRKTQNEINS